MSQCDCAQGVVCQEFIGVSHMSSLQICARRTLSKSQRLQYLKSVQCLLQKPAITPSIVVPGAVSRYDDLVATHINQTMSIHLL